MAKRGERKPAAPEKKPAQPASPGAEPAFPLHEHIGRQLRTMFDEVVAQPVPDKFKELLDQLDSKVAKTKKAEEDESSN